MTTTEQVIAALLLGLAAIVGGWLVQRREGLE